MGRGVVTNRDLVRRAGGGGTDVSEATDRRGAAAGKLPLWDAICLAYSTFFYFFADVLRISWLWLVVVVPLTVMANWLQWTWMAGVIAQARAGTAPQVLAARPLGTMVLGHAAGLAMIFAGVSIAVAWHRRLILGERPGLSGSNVTSRSLWHYVGVGLLIALIAFLPLLVIALPTFLLWFPAATGGARAAPGAGFVLLLGLTFVLYPVAFAVLLRLSLLLPARAVGEFGLTFKQTWRRTRGNTWRMFWGILACMMVPVLAAEIILLVVVGLPSAATLAGESFVARTVAVSTVFTIYYLLVLPIGIGFLSISYRHFFERAQPLGDSP
jgi:hypothetical protein